jgi:heme-degrading monooxygenase HmoA
MAYHVAQINVGLPLEPLDSARLADFVAALDPVNALADAAPGFVWRLQTEDGNATAIRVLDDDRLIVNMSVWESVEALAAFVYRSAHTGVMRRRREWFVPMRESVTALWWVPAGTVPTVAEGETRLRHLHAHGPTPHAFTFRDPFPSPDGVAAAEDDWFCPA